MGCFGDCLNCDLLDLYGISIAVAIRSLDHSLSTRLMDSCDFLDCLWLIASDELTEPFP